MKKIILLVVAILIISCSLLSQVKDSLQLRIKEIEQSLIYIKGAVVLDSGNAVLTVPPSFKFLNRPQSIFVITKIFGNPNDNSILGMLVLKNKGILDKNGWVFTISYEGIGYIDDSDAAEVNYDNILTILKKEVKEENSKRQNNGFNSYKLIGWASPPFYDKNKNVLHWAKEVKFGNDKVNTLNYNLRILGRKGVYVLNAVANMDQLYEVESLIDEVIASIQFLKGNKYADYHADIDNAAKFSIGSLVTGKINHESRKSPKDFIVLIVIILASLIVLFQIWKYLKSN